MGRSWNMSRYSPLDQITAENVNDLEIAWSWSTKVWPGHNLRKPINTSEKLMMACCSIHHWNYSERRRSRCNFQQPSSLDVSLRQRGNKI